MIDECLHIHVFLYKKLFIRNSTRQKIKKLHIFSHITLGWLMQGGRLSIFKIFSHPQALQRPCLSISANQCPRLNIILIQNFVQKISSQCTVLVNQFESCPKGGGYSLTFNTIQLFPL